MQPAVARALDKSCGHDRGPLARQICQEAADRPGGVFLSKASRFRPVAKEIAARKEFGQDIEIGGLRSDEGRGLREIAFHLTEARIRLHRRDAHPIPPLRFPARGASFNNASACA